MPHRAGQVYHEAVEHAGLSVSSPRHGCREFSLEQLPGAYRRLLCRPREVRHSLLHYDDTAADLITTELGVLEGGATTAQGDAAPDAQGKHVAVCLEFTLPAAAYATMLLRELTKQATSHLHLQVHAA